LTLTTEVSSLPRAKSLLIVLPLVLQMHMCPVQLEAVGGAAGGELGSDEAQDGVRACAQGLASQVMTAPPMARRMPPTPCGVATSATRTTGNEAQARRRRPRHQTRAAPRPPGRRSRLRPPPRRAGRHQRHRRPAPPRVPALPGARGGPAGAWTTGGAERAGGGGAGDRGGTARRRWTGAGGATRRRRRSRRKYRGAAGPA